MYNIATGRTEEIGFRSFAVLDALQRWSTFAGLLERVPDLSAEGLELRLEKLIDFSFVESTGRSASSQDELLDRWGGWLPEAGHFHFSTKDTYLSRPESGADRGPTLVDRPSPSPLKQYPDLPCFDLPPFPREGAIPETLLGRRTWRQFGPDPVSIQELSTLLGLTWGVQQWAEVSGSRRVPLKTSPSGGARHSIEAYVLVLDVDQLTPGLYHYAPDEHGLVQLRLGVDRDLVDEFLPHQSGYKKSSFVVFMTSIFERVQWRYNFARAYRVILLEAGHLCQNFCLVATWLRLGPWCTAALSDSMIEHYLKIDGIGESVVYVAGAGTRPAGMQWGVWPDSDEQPPTHPPHHERERRMRRQEDDG